MDLWISTISRIIDRSYLILISYICTPNNWCIFHLSVSSVVQCFDVGYFSTLTFTRLMFSRPVFNSSTVSRWTNPSTAPNVQDLVIHKLWPRVRQDYLTESLVDVEGYDEVLVAHLRGLECERAHDAGHIELEQVGRPLDLDVAAHLHTFPTCQYRAGEVVKKTVNWFWTTSGYFEHFQPYRSKECFQKPS